MPNLQRVTACLLLTATTACGGDRTILAPPSEGELVALVQSVQYDRLLVLEGTPGEPFPSEYSCTDQSGVTVPPAIEIVDRRRGTPRPASLSDLRAGQIVALWLGEIEVRTCPRGVDAARIEILR